MIVDASSYPVHELQQVATMAYNESSQQQNIYPQKPANTANNDYTYSNSGYNNTESYFNNFKLNVGKFITNLRNITAMSSSSRCARSIRIALQSAGAKFSSHPVAAADWGDTLTEIGYKQIPPAFDNPKEGDIYIIERTSKHRYGHIAGYSGSAWVSDYIQASHDVYRSSNVNVSYKYFRL